MKVLVTGGSGFIGSHVVDALVAEGHRVVVLDRVEPAFANPEATYLRADIRHPATWDGALDGVDVVCHQAARVGLGVDMGDVCDYVADNDSGTARMLHAFHRAGFCGRLVLASSMVVYGEGLSHCPDHGAVRPQPRSPADLAAGLFEPRCPRCDATVEPRALDEDTASDPRNVYAATKLHQEHLCTFWAREAGASLIVLRYHNVYGPRMPADTPYAGVASIFLSALAAGRAPAVFEDGAQQRDFVHVQDVARANLAALAAPRSISGVFNVASGEMRTVGDLARALAATFAPRRPSLEPVTTGRWRMGDVRHVLASPRRARDVLGFSASIPFATGIASLALAPDVS